MTPLLCCRNWDIWRKISPQLGLQRTWRHVRKKSGGNRNWKLWRWHCCGDQQSCRAGWRKLFRSSYLLLIRDRKKNSFMSFGEFCLSHSPGVHEHSSWCLDHPASFRQWCASWHEVQHTLCSYPVSAIPNQLLQLVWWEETQCHVWPHHVRPKTQTQVGGVTPT